MNKTDVYNYDKHQVINSCLSFSMKFFTCRCVHCHRVRSIISPFIPSSRFTTNGSASPRCKMNEEVLYLGFASYSEHLCNWERSGARFPNIHSSYLQENVCNHYNISLQLAHTLFEERDFYNEIKFIVICTANLKQKLSTDEIFVENITSLKIMKVRSFNVCLLTCQ